MKYFHILNAIANPTQYFKVRRSTDLNLILMEDIQKLLRELSELLCSYDFNPNAMGREDMIITGVRKILEREVKKEDIWPNQSE